MHTAVHCTFGTGKKLLIIGTQLKEKRKRKTIKSFVIILLQLYCTLLQVVGWHEEPCEKETKKHCKQ